MNYHTTKRKENKMKEIKEETMPDDIILDLARTVEILADSHNCDDGSLKLRGLDWAYLHKLNTRAQRWLKSEVE